MKQKKIILRRPNLVSKIIDGEAVILLPEEGEVLALNEVGSFIWEHIDGNRNQAEIARDICNNFTVSLEEAEGDLAEFMSLLMEKNIIAIA